MTTATADVEALRSLVADVQRGHRPAAEEFVRAHDSWVRSVIYGVTGRPDLVDDIAQQVWLQVWERIDSLQDPGRLRAWLYSIARHAAIDAGIARNRQARSAELPEYVEDRRRERADESPLRGVLADETQRVLLRAVESLPAIYREPFVLRHLEDWSYAEIAEALGLVIETVETRLVRARRLLRETLQGKLGEPG